MKVMAYRHLRRWPRGGSICPMPRYVRGFCILFAFIGTFTYVNFVLTRPPLSLGAMQLGFVYFVFLPSIFTTPLAGAAVQRYRHATDPVGRSRHGRPFSLRPICRPCLSAWLSWESEPFRSGHRHRVHQPRCHHRPGCRQWSLPCILLLGRARRQRGVGPSV
jgi:hypothetical protein